MRKDVQADVTAPSLHRRRTADEDAINRRRLRARAESFVIQTNALAHPICSNSRVKPASGLAAPAPPKQNPSLPARQEPLPADRPMGFAHAVRERINGALLRCEEQYPQEEPHPVLYVVVERDAAHCREQLGALHQEFFGPGQSDPSAPVSLEVVDRATDEALRRLIAAGLVSRTTRASRRLWPDEGGAAWPPLSEAEHERAAAFRARAARQLKMAGVLSRGDLAPEARQAMMEAIEPLGCALAVESRLSEPRSLEEALLPPLGAAWKEALPLVRSVLRDPSQPLPPVLSALAQI